MLVPASSGLAAPKAVVILLDALAQNSQAGFFGIRLRKILLFLVHGSHLQVEFGYTVYGHLSSYCLCGPYWKFKYSRIKGWTPKLVQMGILSFGDSYSEIPTDPRHCGL